MSELTFTGKLTEIHPPRVGTTEKGEWANVEFEVTESNPQNPLYPQIAKFDFFKNGEHVKFAKDFGNYYKVGDTVIVSFNLKRNEYTNQKGELVKFYKTSAWKVEKSSVDTKSLPPAGQVFEPAGDLNEDDGSDLPF